MSQWRALSAQEVSRLSEQGCTCTDWSQVQIAKHVAAKTALAQDLLRRIEPLRATK